MHATASRPGVGERSERGWRRTVRDRVPLGTWACAGWRQPRSGAAETGCTCGRCTKPLPYPCGDVSGGGGPDNRTAAVLRRPVVPLPALRGADRRARAGSRRRGAGTLVRRPRLRDPRRPRLRRLRRLRRPRRVRPGAPPRGRQVQPDHGRVDRLGCGSRAGDEPRDPRLSRGALRPPPGAVPDPELPARQPAAHPQRRLPLPQLPEALHVRRVGRLRGHRRRQRRAALLPGLAPAARLRLPLPRPGGRAPRVRRQRGDPAAPVCARSSPT